MNQNRAQRYTTVILALLGLFLGSNVGVLFDQAAGLTFNAALWPAFQSCGYCLEAGVPLVAEVIQVNGWTLLGALAGTLIGLLAAAVLRWQRRVPDSQPRRLSSLRQAAEVARFSRALSDTLELQPILARLHEEVIHVTGADCGSSFLLDPASPEHRVALRIGEGAGLQRLSAMEALAVSNGRSRIVQDFEAEGEAPPHVGVRSALLVPITHEGNAIGLIHLHSQQPAAFDSEFHDFVDVLATQAAVAIQNARRYDEQARRSEGLRQRVNQLQQLSQIPNAVRIDRPLTGNLQAIAQTMRETADFSLVLISVFVPAGNQLVHTASAGLTPEAFEGLRELPLPWERLQPFLREENRSNRVYRVPQSQTADLFQALDLGRPKKAAEPRAPGQWQPDDMLLVPLYGSRGEIEGLLSVGAPRDQQTPPSLVLEMLEIFASQAALAVENAQLLAQAEERVTESQERAVQLSALTEATGAIATALRVDEVVALTLDQLRRVIPYDTATYWQRDLSNGQWRVLGARSYHDAVERVVARMEQSQAAVFSEISATRGAVFVPDVSRDARFSAKEASSMRSWLGVPVLSSGEVSGILSLEKGEDNFYGPSHVPLALSFANRVASAMDNARQFEESVLRAHELEAENSRRARDLETRSQRLVVFNRLAAGLAEARDLDSLLDLTLKTLSQALGVEIARGVILDPETPRESARVMSASRLPATAPEPAASLELGEDPLIQRLQENAAPLIIDAAESGPEQNVRPEHFQWLGSEVGSALYLPLLADGRLVGLLGFGGAGGRKFTPADGDLGWAVAQQTVTTLQYLRVRERAQEQSIVQQLARSLSRADSYSDLYSTVQAQLSELVGLQNFSLALYDASRDQVTFPLVVEGGQLNAAASDGPGRAPTSLISHILQTRQGFRLRGNAEDAARPLAFALATPGQHPVRGDAHDAAPAAAYLAEPLLVGEKILGVLVAEASQPAESFDERAERILAAGASQIALVVDKLRAKDQARHNLAVAQERASDFETLNHAAAALSASLRSDDVAAAALQQLQRIFGFDRGSVWLREPGSSQAGWTNIAVRGAVAGAAGETRQFEPRSAPAEAAAARQTLVVADTSLDSRFSGAGRAWMGIPLVSQGEVVGLIELEKYRPGAYSAAQAPLVQALAERATQALNNALQYEFGLKEKQALKKRYEAVEERLQEQVLVYQVSRALSRALDLRQVLDSLRAQMDAWFGPASLTLALYDETRHEVSYPLVAIGGQLRSLPAGAPEGVVRHILETQQPLRLEGNLPEQLIKLGLAPNAASASRSFLGVPLVTPERIMGVLTLSDPTRLPVFDERHERSLAVLASQVAVTIENARLYEMARQAASAAQERAGQLVTLMETLAVVTSALRVDQVMSLALNQLQLIVPYDSAAVWERLPAEDEWRLAASRRSRAANGDASGPEAWPLPASIASNLVAARSAVSVPNLSSDSRFEGNGARPAAAWLAVPVAAQGEVNTILVAQSAEAGGYRDTLLPLAQTFAYQTALALENARRYEDSLQRAQDIERRGALLVRAASLFGGALELNGLLALTVRILAEALDANRGAGMVLPDAGQEATGQLLAWAAYPLAQTVRPAMALNDPLLEHLGDARRPLAVSDWAEVQPTDRSGHADWLGAGLQSALFFPLLVGERLIGLVGLGYADRRAFSPADLELGMQLANQAAAAVSSALLYGDLQDRLAEQSTIDQAIRATSRAGDLQQLVEILSARLAAWIGSDQYYLALFDEERNTASLPLLVDSGTPRGVDDCTPGGLLRHVLQTRRPVRLSGDIATQCRELGIPLAAGALRPARWAAEAGEAMTAQAFLGVPILFGDRVLGMLAVEATGEDQSFTERQERILSAIAAQVALMLDNLRLYEQTSSALAAAQDRVAQLEALAAALSVIATALYSEDVTDIALDQFQRVIAYDRAIFWRREAGGAGREGRWRAVGSRGYADGEEPQHTAGLVDGGLAALFAEMASNHRILFLTDLARDSRFQSESAPSHAWLGVPLVNKSEVIGLLTAEKTEPGYYHAGQVATAQILANQITAVLANTRQYESSVQRVLELDEQSRRLAFLNRFGAELSASLDLNSILQLTLKALAESLGAEQATAAVFDENRSAVLALQHYPGDQRAGLQGMPGLPGNSLIDRLQEIPAPITVEDITAPETPARLRQGDWIGREVKAAMFLPLVASGKLIGLIGLGESAAGRRYTATETDLSMALANQAAIAAQNARLYDHTVQRLAEQASINQMSRSLGRALDLRGLCKTVREQLEAWISPEGLYLALYDANRNEVSFPLAQSGGQPVTLAAKTPTGLLRHLLQTREPVRLNGDIGQQLKDLGLYVTGLHAAGDPPEAELGSTLAVPLVTGDQTLGALILSRPRRAELFDETHERILEAVAAQLTASLGQAQQYEHSRQMVTTVQARATQLGLLSEASTEIASALRSDQVLELTLSQAQRVLTYDSASLWQRNGSGDHWRRVATRGEIVDGAAAGGDPAGPNDSPISEVLTTRACLLIADAGSDARFASRPNRPGSWLGVPLIHQGNLLAVLALEKAEANTFTAAQVPLAQAFAQQAAVALANVRRYEDSVQRAFELDQRSNLLNRVAATLSQTMEPAEVLSATLAALAEALGVSRGAGLLFDESRSASRVRATTRYPAGGEDSASSLPLTGNVLIDHLRDRLAPVMAADIHADPLVRPEYGDWIGPDTRSALFLPLAVAGELLGLVGIAHSGQRQPFVAGEIEFAMTLANQAALAAHNARQYQQTQRRLTELATIGQASRAVSQTIDLKQVYETVRTHIEVSLRADSYYLALYDEARGEVSYPLVVERGQTIELSSRAPDSLIRKILDTGQPLVLSGDTKLSEVGRADAGEPDVSASRAKSYLGVPLLLGTRVTGVLAVADYQRAYAFTDKHERSLATIAAPIAAAVDGARLFAESAQRARALDARGALLGRISVQLSESGSLSDILQVAAQAVAETLMVDVGGAFVLDETPGALLPLASARYPAAGEDVLPAFIPAGSPLLQQLQTSLAPIALSEIAGQAANVPEITGWLGEAITAALFLPLVTADRLIGVVAAAQSSRAREFTPGEIDLAMSLTNQAAVAVANAYLQEKMQPRLVELAAISRVCQAIARPANLAQLWETIRMEVSAALEATSLVLALYDAAAQAVSYPVVQDAGQSLTATPRAPAGAIAYILQNRAPLLLNGDIEAQLSELGGEYRALVAGARVPVSYLGVPLMLSGQVIGVLAVEDDQQLGKYGQSQAFILKTIAAPIAVAIDNARLQVDRQARAAELVERVRQLALLNRLSSGLMGSLEAGPILRLVADELQAAVPMDHAVALLLAPRSAGSGEYNILLADPAGASTPDTAALTAIVDVLRRASGGAVSVPLALPGAEGGLIPEHLDWLAPQGSARLLLPIIAEGGIAGFVGVARARGAPAFTTAEVELALTAVNQAGLAISSARQYAAARLAQAASQNQSNQFDRLAQVTAHLASADTTSAVLSVIQEQLAAALPYEVLTVYEVEDDGAGSPAWLRVLSERGSTGPARQAIDLAQNSLLDEAVSSLAPVAVDDTNSDPRFGGPAVHLPAHRAWLVLPLEAQGRATWVIVVQQAEPGAYQSAHLALAQALAGPLAAALENARQYDAMRQRAAALEAESHRLGMLTQAADDILRAGELPEIFRRSLAAMLQSSGGEQASALLFADPGAGQPEPLFVQYPRAISANAPAISGNPLLERFQHPETRTPVVIGDAAGERIKTAYLAWIAPEVQSAAIVPLLMDDQWIGIIGVGHSQAGGLLPGGPIVLPQLAQQLAAAVANGRKQQQLASTLQEQSALNALSRALNQASVLDQVETIISASMGSLFSANNWYLALFEPGANEVAFRPFVEGGQARPMKPMAPEGVINHLLVTRRPLLLTGDIARQLRELGLSSRGSRARLELGDPSGAKAFLGVPLLAGEQPLGAIALEDRRDAGAFTDEKARLLAALAAQLATAVVRIRAIEQLQKTTRRVAEIEALYQQTNQAMQAAQQELAERTATLTEAQARVHQAASETKQVHLQKEQLAGTLEQWREQLTRLVSTPSEQASIPAAGSVATDDLLIAARALGAQASALYLSTPDSGKVSLHASHGLTEPLLAALREENGLIMAALSSRKPVLASDLAHDPRWVPQAADAAPAGDDSLGGNGASGHGSSGNGNGANGSASIEDGAELDPAVSPARTNGHYYSALALPLLAGERVLGAMVFLSDRPQAFNEASLPIGAAAAGQIVFALQAAAQGHALQRQTLALRQLISGESVEIAPAAVSVPLKPAAEAATTQVPRRARPAPDLPPVVEAHASGPAAPSIKGDDQPVQRPSALRRLVLPAAVLAVIVCLAGAAALNAGPLTQALGGLFGGATVVATSTSAATSTAAGSVATSVPPTAVILPPTQTQAPPSATPTSAPPTNTPPPTDTPLPTPTATIPLPPDVLAAATVNLDEGIVGRLRDGPGGGVIGGVDGGTRVHVLRNRETTPDGIVWVQIRIVDTGRTGWFAENLLLYDATPVP